MKKPVFWRTREYLNEKRFVSNREFLLAAAIWYVLGIALGLGFNVGYVLSLCWPVV